MDNLQIFNFKENEVRTVLIQNQPYFVGKDVADVLGYRNGSRDINSHVDEEDKLKYQIGTSGQLRDQIVINESGVYSLVFGSKLPSAKQFKRWVTSEVLPQIRKTGAYGVPHSFSEALMLAAKQQEQIEQQGLMLMQQKPKVEFFDQVASSSDAIEMATVAKTLNIKGLGRNKLFVILRNKKILRPNNQPYQEYCDRGYFRVVEQKYNINGEVRINQKTLVYQRGLDYIRKLVKEEVK